MALITHIVLGVLIFSSTVLYSQWSKPEEVDGGFREPPAAVSALPFVGHLYGMMQKKFDYYVELSRSCQSPIFTVNLPGQKIYVIAKPALVPTVQKQYRVLAFPPLAARMVGKIFGISAQTKEIIDRNVNGDAGDWGMSVETYLGIRHALQIGPDLDEMNRVMVSDVTTSLEPANLLRDGVRKAKLFGWLREILTSATTKSVYGPMNPFEETEVCQAFWEFEAGIMTLMIGVLPAITARKVIAAREKVAQAFESYFRKGGHEKGSQLAKFRYELAESYGIQVDDIARMEVGGSIAFLVNTVPASFWTLMLIYSHPGLLLDLRAEIDNITRTHVESGKTTRRSLDITSLKSSCPLLLSTYQETLRYRAMGMSVREVMEDTVLDDHWLLKKGALVQIPSRVLHQDPAQWGSDVDEFRPRRFMKGEKHKTSDGERPRDVCFRAFGGGKTLCPGRHFATNEVLALVAMFITRYDMFPRDGEWVMPTAWNSNMAGTIMEPDTDVEVEIRLREGFENVKWEISLEASHSVVALVAEDQDKHAES